MTLVIISIILNFIFILTLNIDPSDNPRFSELLSHRVLKNRHINYTVLLFLTIPTYYTVRRKCSKMNTITYTMNIHIML